MYADEGASSPAAATPCGKRIRFPAEILLIGSSRGLRPSRAHPEAEGTDSPPHLSFSDSAEILWISGRGICKEAIFSPGGKLPSEKISTIPPRRSPGSIGSREGSHPLELSGAVLVEKLVPDEAGCPFEDAVSDGVGVGRSAPLHPLG